MRRGRGWEARVTISHLCIFPAQRPIRSPCTLLAIPTDQPSAFGHHKYHLGLGDAQRREVHLSDAVATAAVDPWSERVV